MKRCCPIIYYLARRSVSDEALVLSASTPVGMVAPFSPARAARATR